MIPGSNHSLFVDVSILILIECQLDDILRVGVSVEYIEMWAEELLESSNWDVDLVRGKEEEEVLLKMSLNTYTAKTPGLFNFGYHRCNSGSSGV